MSTLKIKRLSARSVQLQKFVLTERDDLSAVDWLNVKTDERGALTAHDLPGGVPFASAKLTLLTAANIVKHWLESERGEAFETVLRPVRFIETPNQDSEMTLYEIKLEGTVTGYVVEGNQNRSQFKNSFDTRKQADGAFDESVQYFFAERISSQL